MFRFQFALSVRWMRIASLAGAIGLVISSSTHGQGAADQQPPAEPPEAVAPDVPAKVDVDPIAADTEIAERLERILTATEWFEQPAVRVDEGVVFLKGRVHSLQHKEWAAKLAGNTQDVVAVVNRIDVIDRSMWDLSPAWQEMQSLGKETVQNSPLIGLGVLLLLATWLVTNWSVRGASMLMRRRVKSQLLRNVAARAVAVPVFLLGIYLVLKVSGLTRLAMTVLGGTGLLGLVIGFAFRDIAENFLASILISIQHPFAGGDLVEVAGYKGYVQSVNTRSTLLMTLDGNHVQIPNAIIYKETITNFTANPYTQFSFTVGIGYDDPIEAAQSVALEVVHNHPAVVKEPEAHVLVEALGAATVNLRVSFWLDTTRFSSLKVTSAIIRLTKQAFDEAGISMPDEAREVVFPAGVPVRMLADAPAEQVAGAHDMLEEEDGRATPSHAAEGDLRSEAEEINEQARNARAPESGQNLLES